ncbi:hypothetical protein SAMN04488541_102567 [Thermoflexibacter ruber]|uniref:Uncharacterized protein n=1 Tax=Thermoflexibacter ruber TaxID=1003 RepID=A0A1I2HTH6_9BACT|nr:hypothetical protein SAMN04488541_102567 [Thermoflexibacter ruber]
MILVILFITSPLFLFLAYKNNNMRLVRWIAFIIICFAYGIISDKIKL